MRALRWPRFWLGLWFLAIALVVVLSLTPPPELDAPLPPHFDKLEHFAAYSALAFGAVQLFARRSVLALVAVLLVALGIALEYAQGALTHGLRERDGFDALANSLGVAAGMACAATPLKHCAQRLESWWSKR